MNQKLLIASYMPDQEEDKNLLNNLLKELSELADCQIVELGQLNQELLDEYENLLLTFIAFEDSPDDKMRELLEGLDFEDKKILPLFIRKQDQKYSFSKSLERSCLHGEVKAGLSISHKKIEKSQMMLSLWLQANLKPGF